jgi:hypothetical protein
MYHFVLLLLLLLAGRVHAESLHPSTASIDI